MKAVSLLCAPHGDFLWCKWGISGVIIRPLILPTQIMMVSVQDRERLGTKDLRTKILKSPFSASSFPSLPIFWKKNGLIFQPETEELEPMSLLQCLYDC